MFTMQVTGELKKNCKVMQFSGFDTFIEALDWANDVLIYYKEVNIKAIKLLIEEESK